MSIGVGGLKQEQWGAVLSHADWSREPRSPRDLVQHCLLETSPASPGNTDPQGGEDAVSESQRPWGLGGLRPTHGKALMRCLHIVHAQVRDHQLPCSFKASAQVLALQRGREGGGREERKEAGAGGRSIGRLVQDIHPEPSFLPGSSREPVASPRLLMGYSSPRKGQRRSVPSAPRVK